jgi:hypothetical protein
MGECRDVVRRSAGAPRPGRHHDRDEMTRINEIFEIPERVHQGDFVLKLSEGLSRAEETLRSYVVTPQLERAFDAALALIQAGVESNSSKGAYLHGSFGSGKSHFMAVLSLLLQGNAAARSIPELAGVLSRHNRWTEGRRFLVVPYHLIGATSLESAVLDGYARHVAALHPEAPTPGFYAAGRLFEDARRLRETMGDAAFFGRLGGAGGGQEDSGWGVLSSGWDSASFEAALAAGPGSAERARLIGDLVDAFFASARDLAGTREEGFVSLDEGLVILSRHAEALGYDAVILFLDELILWLASHAADQQFLNREGQKVVKLVESGMAGRPVPLISFIARQRDLRELIGEHVPGAEQLGFADVLNWSDARFAKVVLEDRNLPAIVEKRLLRPKSEEARQQLREAYASTARIRDEVMSTLLTSEGDREMFRQTYPFTPALMQTLVAVSSLLQRERTALKLLLQLLVEQRDTLQLGDIVPVGDLFDVIEAGDEPFTQAMRIRFDQARKLYRQRLIPVLEEQHGVSAEDIAAGLVPDEAKVRAFRNDARLMKTLVLAALAEGVEALRGLTPARLAALNHGTVRSPIPGSESQIVLQKVRGWAARAGEIKVTDDGANPVISLQLAGVDTEGVIENAKGFDNYGNRVQKVRSLLYEWVGISPEGNLLAPVYRLLWRGTWRECEILFRNVRELPPESFTPQHAPWRIIIDFPFDQGDHTLADDMAALQRAVAEGQRVPTLVWIPAFLTPRALEELGRLVVLEHILTGTKLDEYGAHLSQIDREQARAILANQRDQVRQRVRNALLTVYGISTISRESVDTANEPENPFQTLHPGLRLQPPVAASFREGLDHLFGQALRFQYPAHPEFEGEVRLPGLRKVLEVVRRAAETPDGRLEVERGDREEVRRIALPLQLGQMGEAHFVLGRHWIQDFDQKRARAEVSQITVRRLREWIDQPQERGLPREVEALVILAYALQTNRSFHLHGAAVPEPPLERLNDELELREQALPEEDLWRVAVDRAARILGVAVSPLRSAANVARLIQEAQAEAARHRDAVEQYARTLVGRFESMGVEGDGADRLRTARTTHAFLVTVQGAQGDAVVRAIAQAPVATSEAAMGECVRKAQALSTSLDGAQWGLFDAIQALPEPHAASAAEILERVRDALRRDEHAVALAPVLTAAQRDAVALLKRAATQPIERPEQPGGGTSGGSTGTGGGSGGGAGGGTGTRTVGTERKKVEVLAAEVEKVVRELRDDAQKATGASLVVEWEIVDAPETGR